MLGTHNQDLQDLGAPPKDKQPIAILYLLRKGFVLCYLISPTISTGPSCHLPVFGSLVASFCAPQQQILPTPLLPQVNPPLQHPKCWLPKHSADPTSSQAGLVLKGRPLQKPEEWRQVSAWFSIIFPPQALPILLLQRSLFPCAALPAVLWVTQTYQHDMELAPWGATRGRTQGATVRAK